MADELEAYIDELECERDDLYEEVKELKKRIEEQAKDILRGQCLTCSYIDGRVYKLCPKCARRDPLWEE